MHTPLDKRVFQKEAVSLAKAGLRVIHVAPDDTIYKRIEQDVELVTYRRRRGLSGRLRHLFSLYRLGARNRADVYHCNEVDSWLVGVLLKLRYRKRVVFDVHEHYRSVYSRGGYPRWIGWILTKVVHALFGVLIPLTDKIVFAKSSIVPDFTGSETKHVLARNYAPLDFQGAAEIRPRTEAGPAASDAPMTVVHIGAIARHRGWPELVEAISRTRSPVRLHVIGTFTDGSLTAFWNRVDDLGIRDRIRVDEWMAYEEAFKAMVASDVGVVALQPGIQNHVFALPHKMFDYMLAGLAVIAPAFAVEVAEIVREADSGVLIDTSDATAITTTFDQLAADPAERIRLAENGRRAVLERYNWDAEARNLIRAYEQMTAS